MKNVIKTVFLLSLFGLYFTSCKNNNEDKPTGSDKPTIENLAVSPTSSVKYGDVVTLTGSFEDGTALSSYDIVISNAQGNLYSDTRMLTGKTFSLNASLVIPLPKNAQAGDVTISVTLKNSGNKTETENVTLSGVAVPVIDALYLIIGSKTYTLAKEGDVYQVVDIFAANAAGKIYLKADKSGMFWGSESGTVTSMANDDIIVGKSSEQSLKVTFNPVTFAFSVEDGDAWVDTDEEVYIYGTISGHWMDHNEYPDDEGGINVEQPKMKMTGQASGNKRRWTWTPPDGGDDGPEDGMWGHIDAGKFTFKKAGAAEYITWDGSSIVTGTSYDITKGFSAEEGGWFQFVLYFDGTDYQVTLEAGSGATVDYTKSGLLVNGLQVPASMTFAGQSLAKMGGSLYKFEGIIDLQKDANITAVGVNLSLPKADPDVFQGEGSTTWKMIGSSGEWLIRVDPFLSTVYACKQSGYPDAIYMDGWSWEKFADNPATNWVEKYLCLQRVNETDLIYEATFYNFGWTDFPGVPGRGADVKFFAEPTSVQDHGKYLIAAKHFDVDAFKEAEGAGLFMGRTLEPTVYDWGEDYGTYMKVTVDLKDGIIFDEDTPFIVSGTTYFTSEPKTEGQKFSVTWEVQ